LIETRAALLDARLRGIRSVRDAGGGSIEYKSDAEMAGALAAADREIALLSGDGGRLRRRSTILFSTSKGL